MSDYRLYRLRPNGEVITPPEEFFATSDEAAINHGGRQPWPDGCEIWCADRFVAVVTRGASLAKEQVEQGPHSRVRGRLGFWRHVGP